MAYLRKDWTIINSFVTVATVNATLAATASVVFLGGAREGVAALVHVYPNERGYNKLRVRIIPPDYAGQNFYRFFARYPRQGRELFVESVNKCLHTLNLHDKLQLKLTKRIVWVDRFGLNDSFVWDFKIHGVMEVVL